MTARPNGAAGGSTHGPLYVRIAPVDRVQGDRLPGRPQEHWSAHELGLIRQSGGGSLEVQASQRKRCRSVASEGMCGCPQHHSLGCLCELHAHHRRVEEHRFRKQNSTLSGEDQGFIPTIGVGSNPRFPPQLVPLSHGATFPGRVLREPRLEEGPFYGTLRERAQRWLNARADGACTHRHTYILTNMRLTLSISKVLVLGQNISDGVG
jgi:hypothetical protein